MSDFADCLVEFPLNVSTKSLFLRIRGEQYRCPGMNLAQIQKVADIYQYEKVKSCQTLVNSIWTDELFYRVNLISKKQVKWTAII
jgi:hypothetical protein